MEVLYTVQFFFLFFFTIKELGRHFFLKKLVIKGQVGVRGYLVHGYNRNQTQDL